MNAAENIENLIKKFCETKKASIITSDEMDKKVLNDALAEYEKSNNTNSVAKPPNIWRMIMNKPITKLATAAAVILIGMLAITFLDKTVTPAWAIEDTIELLAGLNGMHFTGTLLDEEGKEVSFEAWARANEEQTASNHLRIETETGAIQVVSGDKRYQYDPATAIVKLTEGYGAAMSPWPGADFFESLKEIVLDWNETYGKDPATGRDRVFVTCSHPAAPSPRSFWFEFDVESKLPVSVKQWENMRREGRPGINVKSLIFFETLPDELFDFKIPEGAEVIPALAERNEKLQDRPAGKLQDVTGRLLSKAIGRQLRYCTRYQSPSNGNTNIEGVTYKRSLRSKSLMTNTDALSCPVQ